MFRSGLFDKLIRRGAKKKAATPSAPNGLGELRQLADRLVILEAEQVLSEERILRYSTMVAGINMVLLAAVTYRDPVETARMCLAVAEELTNSKFGFIGTLNEAGLFDDIAISDPGWDACIIPESKAVKLIQNMSIRGVDRSTMRDKKSRIVNDPASHPDHIEPPKGHPVITSFLGVPLWRKGEVIGMIGLANSESGYELVDQETIEALSVPFVEALMYKEI